MIHAHSKLTSQGQVSIPASVRRALGLTTGSMLEWVEEQGHIIVKRATRHDTQAAHDALFPAGEVIDNPSSLEDLKQGIASDIKRRHARS